MIVLTETSNVSSICPVSYTHLEYLSMMEADDRKKSHKLYNIACAKFLKHMKGDRCV